MSRLVVAVFVVLAGCSREQPPEPESSGGAAELEHGHEHPEEGAHEVLPTMVRLPEAVLRASGVKVAPVRFEALAPTMDLTGEVIADPDLTGVLVAQVPGRLVEVRFKEGERVKAGAVVAVVESGELARARAAFTAASAKAEAARRNAKRLETLAADGLSSGQERATADAEAAALEAEAAAAKQALAAFGAGALESGANPARLAVRAPLEDFVLSRHAVVGQVVGGDC